MKKQRQKGIKQKRFGQHFLSDPFVLDAIVEMISPQKEDTIIEVGSGKGVLTEKLLQSGANVIGVELDNDLIPELNKKFVQQKGFRLVHGDILDYKPSIKGEYKLAGNIPYSLTTKLFEKMLMWEQKPSKIVFLIQKEVGEKIVERGGKSSPLSLLVSLLGKPRIVLSVPPHAFTPPPKVESVVISIDCSKAKTIRIQGQRHLGSNLQWQLYDFAHKIFRNPRKTLLNNLLSLMTKEKALKLCQENNIDVSIRPERLSFEQLYALYKTN